MHLRNQILSNLRDYSAEDLANAIKDGIVTIYDLSKTGRLTPLMRKRIMSELENTGKGTFVSIENPVPVSNPAKQPSVELSKPCVNSENYNKFPDNIILSDDTNEISIERSRIKTKGEPKLVKEHAKSQRSKKGMFKRPFSFSGRIRRLEFGLSFIIYIVWWMALEQICFMFDISSGDMLIIMYLITVIPAMWFLWAQGAKRCHDRGNSGWFQIIPFYGLWMLFAGSDPDKNEYGDCPK